MSETLRIAVVAEGPTDIVVIESALRAILGTRDFVLSQLQPEASLAFGPLGGGWTGVYRWCHQAAQRGQGKLSGDGLLFLNHDLLILHLDADVADVKYKSGDITPIAGDGALPCVKPCPPASDTTNDLRTVLLSWCGEKMPPPRVVICMPSKASEAWVVAALFPKDIAMKKGIECYEDPERRLGQQPKRVRIKKCLRDYRIHAHILEGSWGRIATPTKLGEAHRFQTEFSATLSALEGSRS